MTDPKKVRNIECLFEKQLPQWGVAAGNYSALGRSSRREIKVGGATITLLHNPARIQSTGAMVDEKSIAARRCFLCESNLPGEQLELPLGEKFQILVNPFPILSPHFTIASRAHERQTNAPEEMVDFVNENPDFVAFFNGASAGASAPDHLHFQAVRREELPLIRIVPKEDGIFGGNDTFPATFVHFSGSMDEMKNALKKISLRYSGIDALTSIPNPDLINIFVYKEDEGNYHIVAVPRKAHRPKAYFEEGEKQLLVSPGALDVAGLIVVPRERDYDRITDEDLRQIFFETTYTASEFQRILESQREPTVRVGIIEDGEVEIHLKGNYREEILEDCVCHLSEDDDCEAFIPQVLIGKEFHWHSLQPFRLKGSLELRGEKGEQSLINIIPLEEYLISVISSEMNSNAPLEFLKAHAIISRSWVMGKIYPLHQNGSEGKVITDEEICDWLDTADHDGYHVCADDHCQRYQGISEVNQAVREAVESTRGEVIADLGGKIIDARFSKCCGGLTERFSSCWQDMDYPYLESVECGYCNPGFLEESRLSKLLHRILKSYDRPTADYYYWETEVSPRTIENRLKSLYNKSVGEVEDLKILRRGPSGRVVTLEIVGNECSLKIGKELAIRRILSENCLYSSRIEIEREKSGKFLIRGRGWGHGVGMCQIGGAVMAEAGKTAEDIISKYYPSTYIKKLY